MSIYQACYDLIHTYIYGGIALTTDMSLVCTIIATLACLIVFVLPFFIVFKIIRLFIG